jgi:predicted RNA-binding protein YlxR (DUF448 family)
VTANVRASLAPIRTCVGCRKARAKVELVRLVRADGGAVVVDVNGRMPGRGAYVCADAGCLERGLRRDRLAHALRGPCRVTADLGAAVLAAAGARDAAARDR